MHSNYRCYCKYDIRCYVVELNSFSSVLICLREDFKPCTPCCLLLIMQPRITLNSLFPYIRFLNTEITGMYFHSQLWNNPLLQAVYASGIIHKGFYPMCDRKLSILKILTRKYSYLQNNSYTCKKSK